MSNQTPLPCNQCGHQPKPVVRPQFHLAQARECRCGRRTAWHEATQPADAAREALCEWNKYFGLVDTAPIDEVNV